MSILIKNGLVLLDDKVNAPKRTDVYIDDNGEVALGEDARAHPRPEHVIDGTDRLVIRGFNNAHTHIPMILLRGLADDVILDHWLQDVILPAEKRLTSDMVYWSALAALLEMIHTGTTMFISGYYWQDATIRAVEEAGLRAKLGIGITDFRTAYYLDAEEALRKAESSIRASNGSTDKIELWLAPHSIYSCSEETLLRSKELAEKYGTGILLHASETRRECIECFHNNGRWPIEYLDHIKFLSENVYLAHASWLTKMEISVLKRQDVKLVHCPVSNMKLASGGTMPLMELLSAGVEVLIGTDGPASNNSLDMMQEMKFAALVHKAHRWDPTAITARTVFDIATHGNEDIILIGLKDVRMRPRYDLISNLVYSHGNVTDMIVDGEFVMRDNVIQTLSEEDVLAKFDDKSQELMEGHI